MHYEVSENQKKWFFIVILVDLEGAGKECLPPVAWDAFDMVWLVGLTQSWFGGYQIDTCLLFSLYLHHGFPSKSEQP